MTRSSIVERHHYLVKSLGKLVDPGSGRLVSIEFMEPDLVPRVEALGVSCGRKYAADSVVFRPRRNEAGGPADRAFGIALAQGD